MFNEYDKERGDKIFSIVWKVLLGIFLLVTILLSIYTINEDEDAVITTFGTPSIVEDSGLHFKMPFIQKLDKVDMSVRGMAIGYDANGNSIENESLMITKDFNFVNVDFLYCTPIQSEK